MISLVLLAEGGGLYARAPSPSSRASGGNQRFLKTGWRFSTKAAMPSFWSAVPKLAWNSRRSKRMP